MYYVGRDDRIPPYKQEHELHDITLPIFNPKTKMAFPCVKFV